MGQDYSYSQPSSSSNSLDITSLLEAEAQMYADEAVSSYCNAEPFQYPPQPEADDGIPTTCYCCAEPVVGCSYTPKDPYRRYFTCENVDDGDCHVWKWWDVAVMEEMRDFQRELRQLKSQGNESEQKLLNLEKTVYELSKKKSGVKLMVCLLVLIGLVLLILRSFAKGSKESGVPREFL
ncbi:hypothetical protein Bca4012_058705 [Brassica carinata]